jgi:hypothetical protein
MQNAATMPFSSRGLSPAVFIVAPEALAAFLAAVTALGYSDAHGNPAAGHAGDSGWA